MNFNREVKAVFSESRCLEEFSCSPHSRQNLFSLKDFNAMLSVCLSLVSLEIKLLKFRDACAVFSSSGFSPFLRAAVTAFPSRLRFRGSNPRKANPGCAPAPRAAGLRLIPRGFRVRLEV